MRRQYRPPEQNKCRELYLAKTAKCSIFEKKLSFSRAAIFDNLRKSNKNISAPQDSELFEELSKLIEDSRRRVAVTVNSTLVLLYWQIGKRINEEVLKNKRTEYGKQIVSMLATQLKEQYGRSFEEKNLRRTMQFVEQSPDEKIVVTVSRQLSWSHILDLLPLKKKEPKLFYIKQISENLLSVRELREQIKRKTFERAEIANSQLSKHENIPLDAFKDPSILDLLFFHRKLKRLVAIELKLGKFHASDKGQMELYLQWLDRYERQEREEKPIGLILCAETIREQVELLELHKDGIMVAEYWTELPPKKELKKRLHQALIDAREQLGRKDSCKNEVNEDYHRSKFLKGILVNFFYHLGLVFRHVD